jgi:serine protease Do
MPNRLGRLWVPRGVGAVWLALVIATGGTLIRAETPPAKEANAADSTAPKPPATTHPSEPRDARGDPSSRGLSGRNATTRPAVPAPKTLSDLREIERQVQAVVKKASPATVGVTKGNSQGSGVIVTKDGYVLTAGHVAAEPDQDVRLILADGRRVRGKTLGMNLGIDSGLIKITQEAPKDGWPFAEMGKSGELKPGQWVAALGHPGGYRRDRPPVLRLGRVLTSTGNLVVTDCTLVGGDSGGPLFDLDGKVIGIHSRIGGSVLSNIHVPVDTYTGTWERLAKGDSWGDRFAAAARGPVLGINGENDLKGCRVVAVTPGGAADRAGVKVGDIIHEIDGKGLDGVQGVVEVLARRKAGEEVRLKVLRGDETLELKATLAKRPE